MRLKNPRTALALQRRAAIFRLAVVLLSGALLPHKSDAQDRVGEIVEPATGTGRAVYVRLDQAVILPRFLGHWAVRSGKCSAQKSTDRIDFQKRVVVLRGRRLAVQGALVEIDPQTSLDYDPPARAVDQANTDDFLVDFGRPGNDDGPYVHFRIAPSGTRLIVEEAGKPQRIYVRCS